MGNQLTIDSRLTLNLGRLAAETGWDLQLRTIDGVRVLEVLTVDVKDEDVLSALSAHRPRDTVKDDARALAITVLSGDTLGRAVLELMNIRSDTTIVRLR